MPGDLQYITIDNFTPGIQYKTFGIGDATKSPPGAADPANTFRCRALPWGGLGPMPKLTQTKTADLIAACLGDRHRIVGFHVTGPMQINDYESTITGDDNVELHVALEYHESGGAGDHRLMWRRYRIWETETVDSIYAGVITHPGNYDEWYRGASFVDARLHATDATALGNLFVVLGWRPDDMDSPDNVWRIFPDPDSPGATGTQMILDVNETTILVQHQGRIISIDSHVFQHGGAGYWIVNDQLVYTQTNLPTVEEDPPGTILGVGVFTQGPVSGYGAAASAGAQELLLVKHRGGATTLSGDIDDPTVFSLPGVQSTNGALTFGVFTPLGFAYGVKDGGIHVWGGGDTSNKLSAQLEDDFWQMRPADWVEFDGKLDIAGEMLLVPNNWVYDTITQSWWRIEDPAEYQIFQWAASPQSSMFYGAPTDHDDGGPIYYRFDRNELVGDYVWQSQYIPASLDRVLEIREIKLRALSPNGASEVTVTITDDDGHTRSETFYIESTTIPKLLRIDTHFQGMGLKVTIEAMTHDGIAPIIYDLQLGYQEGQREASV